MGNTHKNNKKNNLKPQIFYRVFTKSIGHFVNIYGGFIEYEKK